MITHEGGTLVSDLIAQGLLDEPHLLVNPTAIGAGMPVFPNLGACQQLRLVTAQRSTAGSPRCTRNPSAPEFPHDKSITDTLNEGVRDAPCTGAVSRSRAWFRPCCQPGWSIVVGPSRQCLCPQSTQTAVASGLVARESWPRRCRCTDRGWLGEQLWCPVHEAGPARFQVGLSSGLVGEHVDDQRAHPSRRRSCRGGVASEQPGRSRQGNFRFRVESASLRSRHG
jgi:hypothetical protein